MPGDPQHPKKDEDEEMMHESNLEYSQGDVYDNEDEDELEEEEEGELGSDEAVANTQTGTRHFCGRCKERICKDALSFLALQSSSVELLRTCVQFRLQSCCERTDGIWKNMHNGMAILRLIHQHSNARIDAKIVYIAPTKALCSERAQDWKKKFRTLGVSYGELTGDTDSSSVREVQQINIIVTTPEKWDSMTRRWRDYKHLMALVQLILIDDVHLLNEPQRGGVLEEIGSRMRTVNAEVIGSIIGKDKFTSTVPVNESSHFLRILAISATMPNIADIAVWLKDARGRNAEIKLFGDEFQPVKLDQYEAMMAIVEAIDAVETAEPSNGFCARGMCTEAVVGGKSYCTVHQQEKDASNQKTNQKASAKRGTGICARGMCMEAVVGGKSYCTVHQQGMDARNQKANQKASAKRETGICAYGMCTEGVVGGKSYCT
ncbi:Sec63, partial [Chytriomyces hyalinus]